MKTSSREPNAASRQTHMSMWPCDMAAQTRVLLSLIQTVLRCVVWVFTSLCSRGQLCQTLSLSHQNHLFYSIFTPLIIYIDLHLFYFYNVFGVKCNKWGKHCSVHGDICSALSNMHPKHTVSEIAALSSIQSLPVFKAEKPTKRIGGTATVEIKKGAVLKEIFAFFRPMINPRK